MPKAYGFVKVGTIHDIPSGQGRHIMAHGKPMALFNIDGNFYAINQICPHMGGPLSEGKLNGNVVTCPWHGWTFCVDTGLPDHPGGHSVSAYEVKVEGEDVLVGWLKKVG
ncbi:MAG: Rieske 2Fe-2S domain-containing protein [Ignavibacteriae bacterium]|nr:Rieske 2Fe-2S domain-containing protein [Ignavibacteriota bacterium]